ncbi:MAG: hypothetical protein AB7K24_16365, partial [Gemmataceae bacterium]
MQVHENQTPKRRRWRELRWSTRLCLLATLALVLVVTCEVLARGYWQIAKHVPIHRSDLLWQIH